MMLTIKNLTIETMKGTLLLDNFNLTVGKQDKIAIIGEEGNGKSTLLKAIANPTLIENYTTIKGSIDSSGCRIGYFSQKLPDIWNEQTALDYCLKNNVNDEIEYERYNDLADLKKLCIKLHMSFDLLESDRPIKTFSGGEKVKLQLLKIMSQPVDLLLLDEPTNDLDLYTLNWLEQFLIEFEHEVIFISHDEVLLSKVANRIVLLEQVNKKTKVRHTIENVGYIDFRHQHQHHIEKAEQLAHKEKEEYEKKQAKLNRIMSSVHDYQNSITRQDPAKGRLLKKKMHAVKSMQKRFEKEGYTKLDTLEEAIDVFFEPFDWNPGKIILDVHYPQVKACNNVLIEDVDLFIKGNEKVVFIGENGCGKSTLLKQVLKDLKTKNLKIGYMPQNYQDNMSLMMTPVEFLSDCDRESITKARDMLGRMKFTRDEMEHHLKDLSEGQKAKCYLLKFIIDEVEVLVLDEPTRNLSPMSNPSVRMMLQDFCGCIISVSHDRLYIEEVADTIYEISNQKLIKKTADIK